MSKKAKSYLVLAYQAFFMLAVPLGPMLERRAFVWSPLPVSLLKVVGLIVFLVGSMIVAASVRAMRGSFTVHPEPRVVGSLITAWPYSKVKNPMYAGGLLTCLGWALYFSSISSFCYTIILAGVLWVKMDLEEEALRAKFGEAYEEYSKGKGRLLPAVPWLSHLSFASRSKNL